MLGPHHIVSTHLKSVVTQKLVLTAPSVLISYCSVNHQTSIQRLWSGRDLLATRRCKKRLVTKLVRYLETFSYVETPPFARSICCS